MADAMRAALQSSSAMAEATQERDMRASYDAINARLDNDLVAKGHSINNLPPLIRFFEGQNNVGPFAVMVDFACTPRQRLVNWRNCREHKNKLTTMDLSDPEAVLRKVEVEACGIPQVGGNNTSTMAGSAVPTGFGPQHPRQTASANLVHPAFAHDRPTTPQLPCTLLSPYSTPTQQPTKIANAPSSSPTQPWTRSGSPYAKNAEAKNVSKTPTPTSSSFEPGSAQEHLQESRVYTMEGHMPHLSTNMYRLPNNSATYSSPYNNQNIASHAEKGYGQAPLLESATVRSRLYNAPVAVRSNRGATHQQQTPYASFKSFPGAGNNQFESSQSGQSMQQNGCAPFGNSSNPRPTYQPGIPAHSQQHNAYMSVYNTSSSGLAYQSGAQAQLQQRNGYTSVGEGAISRPANRPSTQPQPQQRNAKPVMDPLAEFRAAVNCRQTPGLHMPESADCREQVRQHMPEKNNTQPPARISIEVPHRVQPGQHGILIPSGYRPAASIKRHHHSGLSDSAIVQTTIEQPPQKKHKTTVPSYVRATHPNSYPGAATPIPQPRARTKEEMEHEQQLAASKKHKAEKEEQECKEAERKKKLNAELTAELRTGDEVLTHRYREYLEVNPLPKGERPNGYYLSFLANQIVDKSDQTEGAMAVRYAKEKYWNQWKISDKLTVIELLRGKPRKQGHGMFAEMKTGGYLITAADIQAIRQTAPLYAAPEVVLPEVEIEE